MNSGPGMLDPRKLPLLCLLVTKTMILTKLGYVIEPSSKFQPGKVCVCFFFFFFLFVLFPPGSPFRIDTLSSSSPLRRNRSSKSTGRNEWGRLAKHPPFQIRRHYMINLEGRFLWDSGGSSSLRTMKATLLACKQLLGPPFSSSSLRTSLIYLICIQANPHLWRKGLCEAWS